MRARSSTLVRFARRLPALLTPLVLLGLVGCGAPGLTCREPDITSFTAQSVPDALCSADFMKCEDGSYVEISCDNQTFSGDYSCTWLWFGPDLGDVHSGSFESPDFCVVTADEMAAELRDGGGPDISIE